MADLNKVKTDPQRRRTQARVLFYLPLDIREASILRPHQEAFPHLEWPTTARATCIPAISLTRRTANRIRTCTVNVSWTHNAEYLIGSPHQQGPRLMLTHSRSTAKPLIDAAIVACVSESSRGAKTIGTSRF